MSTTNNHSQHDSEEDTMSTEDTEQNTSENTEQDNGNPNREAAKYRRQLRDAEAERDTLAGQLETMQRAAIDAEVTRRGYKPQAFWSREDNELANFYNDDGTLNTDTLDTAITTTADELGLQGTPRPPISPKEGHTTRPTATTTWDSAFRA